MILDGGEIQGAIDLAGLFRAKVISPTQALNASINRIKIFNPTINAFLALDRDRAARDARASDERWAAGRPKSMLDGVAVGVKANIAIAGLPWHGGIAAYAPRVAEVDADCVTALREAGLIILGSLNMHEAALGATNDNLAFGRCHNPYQFGFTPGGSSGGSAAAVAAGLCTVALGTDTMGSVRIPASYCGTFGHKPRHGLVPMAGIMPLSHTLDDFGVLARTAADVSAIMAIVTSNKAAKDCDRALRGMRLGVLEVSKFEELEAEVADKFGAVIAAAHDAGLSLERVELPSWDVGAVRRATLLIVEAEALAVHGDMLRLHPDGFSPQLTEMLKWADRQPMEKIATAYERVKRAGEMLRAAFDGFDAVMTPTTTTPAFEFGRDASLGVADLTLLANVSGLAATAFPTGLSRQGLPLSAQVISADDRIAVQLADLFTVMIPSPAVIQPGTANPEPFCL